MLCLSTWGYPNRSLQALCRFLVNKAINWHVSALQVWFSEQWVGGVLPAADQQQQAKDMRTAGCRLQAAGQRAASRETQGNPTHHSCDTQHQLEVATLLRSTAGSAAGSSGSRPVAGHPHSD